MPAIEEHGYAPEANVLKAVCITSQKSMKPLTIELLVIFFWRVVRTRPSMCAVYETEEAFRSVYIRTRERLLLQAPSYLVTQQISI